MAPQGPNLSNLDPVFCKKSMPIWIREMSFFWGPFFPFFGRQNWPFLRGLTKCQNCGANVRIVVQRGNCNRIISNDHWSMVLSWLCNVRMGVQMSELGCKEEFVMKSSNYHPTQQGIRKFWHSSTPANTKWIIFQTRCTVHSVLHTAGEKALVYTAEIRCQPPRLW